MSGHVEVEQTAAVVADQEEDVEGLEGYNGARPHRALGLRTPIARSDPVAPTGEVICAERLGGLLREYAWEPLLAAA